MFSFKDYVINQNSYSNRERKRKGNPFQLDMNKQLLIWYLNNFFCFKSLILLHLNTIGKQTSCNISIITKANWIHSPRKLISFWYVCHVFISRLRPYFPLSGLLIGLICCSRNMIDSLVLFFCSSTHALLIMSAAYAWLYSSSYCHDHLKTKRNPIGTHWHASLSFFFFFVSFNMSTSANKRTNRTATYWDLLNFF